MSEDSTKGGSKGVEEIRRSLGPGNSGTLGGTLPLPSPVPPAACPRQVPPDLPPNTRLAACGGTSPLPPSFLWGSGRYRIDRLELAWKSHRRGTQAGKYPLKYPTHYPFLFYTPYIIFIIVLCNTNYYRIHITFHYTLPIPYPTLLFICFLLLF